MNLIEFDNKLVVMVQWGWNYFTRGRGARLVTGIGEGKRKDQLQQISPEATETASPVTR